MVAPVGRAGRSTSLTAAAPRDAVFSIDTPPLTVSGALHIGHVCSFTHTDTVARFHRMRGQAVFYPIGWDDNGLPTERRVQNYFHVQCDPALPLRPVVRAAGPPAGDPVQGVPAQLRRALPAADRPGRAGVRAGVAAARAVGGLVQPAYRTIGDTARAISQRAFLRNLARGEAYLAEGPTLWDVTFRTAVAQAELEDREVAGHYYRLAFRRPDGTAAAGGHHPAGAAAGLRGAGRHPATSATPALAGTTVTTPLFGVEVPVLAHQLADPAKGTGLAMVCTFGDLTDVTWWRDLDLPARPVLGPDGRLLAALPPGITSRAGRSAYRQLAGATVAQARQRVAALARRGR